MSELTTYPLRMPKSLRENVLRLAKAEGISINQFLNLAIAEKLAVLQTEEFFGKRRKNADYLAFAKILNRKSGAKPIRGDEIISK